jgi:hypothetical protein
MAMQQESTGTWKWKQTYKGAATTELADKYNSTQQYFSSSKNGCSQQLKTANWVCADYMWGNKI